MCSKSEWTVFCSSISTKVNVLRTRCLFQIVLYIFDVRQAKFCKKPMLMKEVTGDNIEQLQNKNGFLKIRKLRLRFYKIRAI